MTTEAIAGGIIPRYDASIVDNASDQSNLRANLRPIEFQVLCGGVTKTPPVYKTGFFDVGVKIPEED